MFSFCLLLVCSKLYAYEVMDASGKHFFEKPPERVIVTDWALVEQVLELGIQPVGIPEVEKYNHFVQHPELPKDIVDIGRRGSPNLKTMASLNPDVIIVGTDQKSLMRPFSRIGRVMYYKSFSDKYRTNAKKSRLRFLQIADLFQKRKLAEDKLDAMDKELQQLRQKINHHFNNKPPKVTLIRFSSLEKCLVYGKNGIPYHSLEQLGLETGYPLSRSKWGEKEMPIKKLNDIESGVIFYIQPLDFEQELFSSKNWQQLIPIKEKRVYPMQAVWSYGGAMSILYNARAITKTLLTLPVKN
jgi:iron complex transport system substrate-binding protein